MDTFVFGWFWSCLTKASLHVQNIHIAACCKRPDVVCSREVKETRGRGKDTSALELTKNFYSIIQNYFFPFHSVFLGKTSRLFGYKKFQENPVEKWMGHCFSCRSGEKFTGATDHLERQSCLFRMECSESIWSVKPLFKIPVSGFRAHNWFVQLARRARL